MIDHNIMNIIFFLHIFLYINIIIFLSYFYCLTHFCLVSKIKKEHYQRCIILLISIYFFDLVDTQITQKKN